MSDLWVFVVMAVSAIISVLVFILIITGALLLTATWILMVFPVDGVRCAKNWVVIACQHRSYLSV